MTSRQCLNIARPQVQSRAAGLRRIMRWNKILMISLFMIMFLLFLGVVIFLIVDQDGGLTGKSISYYTHFPETAEDDLNFDKIVINGFSLDVLKNVTDFEDSIESGLENGIEMDADESGCIGNSKCEFLCQLLEYEEMMYKLTAQIEAKKCSFFSLKLERISFENKKIEKYFMSVIAGEMNVLEIEDCDVTEISPGAFNSSLFSNTLKLRLSKLNVNEFRPDVFFGLNHVTELTLEEIPFYQIYSDLLKPMQSKLSTLNILQNKNTFLPRTFLQPENFKLERLEDLDLRFNMFPDSIKSGTFDDLKHLTRLSLSESKIEVLPVDIFNDISPAITRIDLTKNSLITLPEGIFDRLLNNGKDTPKIYLAGNPWHCHCSLIFLQENIRKHSKKFPDSPKCFFPNDVKNKTIAEVVLCDNFSTYPPTSSNVSSEVGGDTPPIDITKSTPTISEIKTDESTESSDSTEEGDTTLSSTMESTSTFSKRTTTSTEQTTTSTDPTTTTSTDPMTTTSTDPMTTTSTEQTTTSTDPTTTTSTDPTTTTSTDPMTTTSTEQTTTSTEQTTTSTEQTTTSTEQTTASTEQTTTSTEQTTTSTDPTTTTSTEQTTTSTEQTTTSTDPTTTTSTDPPTSKITSTVSTSHSISPDPPNVCGCPYCSTRCLTMQCSGDSFTDSVNVPISNVTFSITTFTDTSVIFWLEKVSNYVILFYYEATFSSEEFDWKTVSCVQIWSGFPIEHLNPGKIYMFCVAYSDCSYDGLYSCKAHQMPIPYSSQTWLTYGRKTFAMSMAALISLFMFLLGTGLTYLLIYNVPTLLRGNKRVIMVKRHSKSVMVLPHVSSISRESESHSDNQCDSRKSSDRSIKKEQVPNYMTPVPRLPAPRRHIMRSSSEESVGSVRSYVSIGRSAPRFSALPSKRELDVILNKRSESYPSCPPPLPPYPKHRLSIASTAEIGKPMSRETISAFEKNSCPIHKRTDDIADETENHYNCII